MGFAELIPWATENMKKLEKYFLVPKKLILLRAPAGMGKTSVAVAYMIYNALLGKRSALFLRTRKEIEHALRIAKRIVERIKQDLLILPTPSKKELCVMHASGDVPIRFLCPAIDCDRLKRRNTKDIEKMLRGTVLELQEEYIRVLSSGGRCPYIIIKELLQKADIVFGVHEYFSDDELFSLLGRLDIIILDEAHNFILMHREFCEIDLRMGQELVDEYYLKGGKNIGKLVVGLWREGKYKESKAVSSYYQYRQTRGAEIKMNDSIIKVQAPIEIIKNRIDDIKKMIIMSSTLYPSKFFEILFAGNLDHEMVVIPGLMKSPNRTVRVVDSDISMAYKERTKFTLQKYAELILKIAEKIDGNVIVFAPNYDIATALSRIIKAPLVRDKIEQGKIVIAVFRSRISEGVDLPHSFRAVIIAGLPYPKITKKEINILGVYSREYGIDMDILERAYIESSMISALVQAMGRVGRRGKKGFVFIIDRRAKKLFGG